MKASQTVVKDMIQARLLARIFSESLGQALVLKGGMAMRVLTNSMRYTKDIDLMASPDTPVKRVASLIRGALRDMEMSGLLQNFRFTEPKQTETVQRWKISGTHKGTPINLTIEISRRDPISSVGVQSILWKPSHNAEIKEGFFVDTIDISSMILSKIECLASENREAPRDIWDLYILFKTEIELSPDILKNHSNDDLNRILNNSWDKIMKMEWDIAKNELVEYLEPNARNRFTKDLWDDIRIDVASTIKDWISDVINKRKSNCDNVDESKPEPSL